MEEKVDRAHVKFIGTVQGVGFRYTAARIAERCPGITGSVKNMPDGSVEFTAEGSRNKVEELIADISQRMSVYISSTDINWSHGPRHHSRFGISH